MTGGQRRPTGQVDRTIGIAPFLAVAIASSAGPHAAVQESPAASTAAASRSAPSRAAKDVPALAWTPPEDVFDWIQLKSGEWLKGRITAMQDREIVCDSEELDDLSFDWRDIRQVRSGGVMDVLSSSGETRVGRVFVTPGKVEVRGIESVTLDRNDVQGLTPGGNRELDFWPGRGSVGLTMRSGCTDQTEFDARACLQRGTPATRPSLDDLADVSTDSGVETANNHRIRAESDVWLTGRWDLDISLFRDRITNPKVGEDGEQPEPDDYRLVIGPGIAF